MCLRTCIGPPGDGSLGASCGSNLECDSGSCDNLGDDPGCECVVGDPATGGSGGTGMGCPPDDPCCIFDQGNIGYELCNFDEATGQCEFYIAFFAPGSGLEKTCGDHCREAGGGCVQAEDEADQQCVGSGFVTGCDGDDDDFTDVICTCTLPAP